MRFSLISIDKRRGDAHTVKNSDDTKSLREYLEKNYTPDEN